MANRRAILVGVATLIFTASLASIYCNAGEPRYHRRSLSAWISMYLTSEHVLATDEEREKVDDAVRHIGTNAVPRLLEWYAYSWQDRAERADAVYTNLPRTLQTNRSVTRFLYDDPKRRRKSCAVLALSALDSNVLSSNPDFIRFINNTNTFSDWYRARRLVDAIDDLRASHAAAATTPPAEPQ